MAKRIYHETASHYADMLGKIREQIIDSIIGAMNFLGGKVCVEYYTAEEDVDRYTLYETDGDGYGVALYIEDITLENSAGEINITLSDGEGNYRYEWGWGDINTSRAYEILRQVEAVVEFVQDSGKDVVTEYEDYI